VILHSNLAGPCLSEKAAAAVYRTARGFSTLEYDLEAGERGFRTTAVESLLTRLTGAEAAMVVNNNAAAVLLILSAVAGGGDVVVSRGELVEIGGSFRVPEIMRASGCALREVGTTNKTRLQDYENAIDGDVRALLKVHTSNFKIIGFAESVPVKDLAELGHKNDLIVIEDIGSGALADLERRGITNEPSAARSLRDGADIVSFSGDKLLGGPQAGVILGKEKYLKIMKKHPLYRALRIDKMTIAAWRKRFGLTSTRTCGAGAAGAQHAVRRPRRAGRQSGEARRDDAGEGRSGRGRACVEHARQRLHAGGRAGLFCRGGPRKHRRGRTRPAVPPCARARHRPDRQGPLPA
jgi:L-seryl-tRNA(Ser) seleniumtransferase